MKIYLSLIIFIGLCLFQSEVFSKGEMDGKWMYMGATKSNDDTTMFYIDPDSIEKPSEDTILFSMRMRTALEESIYQMQIFLFKEGWVAKSLKGLIANTITGQIKEINSTDMQIIPKDSILKKIVDEALKINGNKKNARIPKMDEIKTSPTRTRDRMR